MTDSNRPLSHLDILIEDDRIAAIGNDLNPAEHHVDEIVADKATGEILPDHVDISKTVSMRAEDAGLIARPIANLNIMSPPLIITEKEVDVIVEKLKRGIEAVVEDLREEDVIA